MLLAANSVLSSNSNNSTAPNPIPSPMPAITKLSPNKSHETPSIGTVISDSGVTTQNINNNTAAVLDKPDTSMPIGHLLALNNSTVSSNNHVNSNSTSGIVVPLASATLNSTGKSGKTHSRGVYKTENIPDTVPKLDNATIATMSIINSTIPIASIAVTNKTSTIQNVTLTTEAKSANISTIVVPANANATTATIKLLPEHVNATVPKKPEITFSVDDDPHLKSIRDKLSKTPKLAHGMANDGNGALSEPIVLQSSELMDDDSKSFDYVVPIIGLIFAVPIIIILANYISHGLKNYWSKRNYQRMDYLINEMYN